MRSITYKMIVWLLSVAIFTNGCASSSQSEYTAQQKQQIETSVIEGTYNNVFNATRTVFLNSGLVLQQVDKDSGFINGVISINLRNYWNFLFLVLGLIGAILMIATWKNFDKGKDFNVTATLIDLNDNSVEVRLQTPLLEKQSDEYGLALKRIFAEIKKQTLILEAAGRE